jgi:LuxR family maltose regulon positive regulatory protein
MSTPLLTTKLYIPPSRPNLVSRPRLVERLNEGLQIGCKLTLISAPAGFGKTTLLSEWVRQTARPVAWVSLDEADDEPIRFWRYAVAALRMIAPSIGETAQAALESSQPPPLEPIVTALINDLAALSTPLVLILDDYHAIKAASIHSSLNLLLDHLSPQLHLIITTRADPPLSLSLRRSRLALTEIRTADLRFTTEETADYLNVVMGLDLQTDDVAALESRTEGWIVGLQMAALTLQGRGDKHDFVVAFAGDDRYVADYLVEEVLGRQSPRVQVFLLQTSILERLSGPLCDAVTGGNDGQIILDHLEEANVFVVPLDSRRQWYRYHHLFADLLRRRLKQMGQQLDSVPVKELHQRASEWYEHEGFVIEAISHALATPDQERAADLIEQYWLAEFFYGEDLLIRRWLAAIPEDLARSRPILCVAQTWLELLMPPQSPERADQWLRDANRALTAGLHQVDKPGGLDHDTYDLVAGHVVTLEAYLARIRGDAPETVIELSSQALDRLPQGSLAMRSWLAINLGLAHLALGNVADATNAIAQARKIGEASDDLAMALAAVYLQATTARRQGRLHEAAAICHEALQTIVKPFERAGRPLLAAGNVHIALGSILLERNEQERASYALAKGLELVALTARPQVRIDGCVTSARLKAAQGDVTEALALIDQAESLWPGIGAYTDALRVRLWLSQAEGEPDHLIAAERWARKRQLGRGAEHKPPAVHLHSEHRYAEQLTLVRVRIAQRRARKEPDLQSVLGYLDRQLGFAEEDGWTERVIELLTLQALALQAQGETPPALDSLARALSLAKPEGYARVFLDEGAPMASLLYQAIERGIAPEYASRLLVAFEDLAEDRWLRAKRPLEPLIEPLSGREVEILQLIAAGLSNREIAQELSIALGTVKVHTSNIYGKLAVGSRTQAVAKARTLGIL